MLIHFARHGETEYHESGKYAGQEDISLNQKGVVQSKELSNWAKKQTLDLIISSDLKRAVDTAKDSARLLNLNLRTESRFREIDFGKVSGLNREERNRIFPAIHEVFYSQPTLAAFPEGENVREAMDRALLGLLELSNELDLSEVLIVCHATLFRLVLSELLGLNPDDYRKYFPKLRNVSISTIEIPKVSNLEELKGCAKLIRYDQAI
jgi:broad specificity phosphatase PhoE